MAEKFDIWLKWKNADAAPSRGEPGPGVAWCSEVARDRFIRDQFTSEKVKLKLYLMDSFDSC